MFVQAWWEFWLVFLFGSDVFPRKENVINVIREGKTEPERRRTRLAPEVEEAIRRNGSLNQVRFPEILKWETAE